MPATGQEARAPLPAPPHLIVTRPADDAAGWVQALRDQGWPAMALPLIEIGPPTSPVAQAALRQHRAMWHGFDAIMFVSGAAVAHFFADGVALPPGGTRPCTRFWAPGPGTRRTLARALSGLGLGEDLIDTPPPDAVQFDSEALWPVVAPQVREGSRLLVVRGASGAEASAAPGGHGRQWLAAQCEAAGATVDAVAAYERHPPTRDAALQDRLAQACVPGSVWLLSSSEAVAHLLAVAPQADWTSMAALATHPRIAETARRAGFRPVVATRPALRDVLATLESHWSRP